MDRADASEVVRLGTRVLATRLRGGRTEGGVGLILNPRGEMLFTLARYRSGWSFPGGYLEPGEEASRGITRELVEEVGYPADGPLVPVVHVSPRRRHVEHFAFAVLSQDDADRLHPTSWEVRAVRWARPGHVPPLHYFARSLLSNGEGVVSQLGNRWVAGPSTMAALGGRSDANAEPSEQNGIR